MSLPLLPAPAPRDDERRPEAAKHSQADARAQQAQGPRRVVSEEDCLLALGSLPALIAMGLLKTAHANSIRGVYTAILQHYRQRENPADRDGVTDEGLIDMLTRHPEYANYLEPLLSAELIATLMARATGGSHGPA